MCLERDLDFMVARAELKNAYGVTLAVFENVNALPVNEGRSYYDTNLGILYIHKGEGKLPLKLALQPLLYLKQALLHTCFINELDKALNGDCYDARLFKNAVDEFLAISDDEHVIDHNGYNQTVSMLFSQIA